VVPPRTIRHHATEHLAQLVGGRGGGEHLRFQGRNDVRGCGVDGAERRCGRTRRPDDPRRRVEPDHRIGFQHLRSAVDQEPREPPGHAAQGKSRKEVDACAGESRGAGRESIERALGDPRVVVAPHPAERFPVLVEHRRQRLQPRVAVAGGAQLRGLDPRAAQGGEGRADGVARAGAFGENTRATPLHDRLDRLVRRGEDVELVRQRTSVRLTPSVRSVRRGNGASCSDCSAARI
jgi:hypothetical protein